MPGWQRFYAAHQEENFTLVSIAVDAQGSRAARRFVETSGATFPTVVDAENVVGALCDARAIPNGLFVDETGIVRYLKLGGFSVDEPADVAAIEGLLQGIAPEVTQARSSGPAPTPDDVARSHQFFREGTELFAHGAQDEAMAHWQTALGLDPENWIIRKQIWAVRYPQRFHPTIDWAWQKEQIARESA